MFVNVREKDLSLGIHSNTHTHLNFVLNGPYSSVY